MWLLQIHWKPMEGAGPAYFSGTCETASRIDCICVRLGLWHPNLCESRGCSSSSYRLQLVGCAKCVDHRPVSAWLFTSILQYSAEQLESSTGMGEASYNVFERNCCKRPFLKEAAVHSCVASQGRHFG